MIEEPLLTPREAGEQLAVSAKTMQTWAKDKKIRAVVIPGRRNMYRFHPDEIRRIKAQGVDASQLKRQEEEGIDVDALRALHGTTA